MRDLMGADAFDALRALMAGEAVDAWSAPGEPSIERLRVAIAGTTPQASALDLAVLLRQALRREEARRGYEVGPRMIVRHHRLAGFDGWHNVGLSAEEIAGGVRIAAEPWLPDWLTTTSPLGVDDIAASEEVRRAFSGQDCAGDPLLMAIALTTSSAASVAIASAAALVARGTSVERRIRAQ